MLWLSVSSNGSNWVKRLWRWGRVGCVVLLSVSSNGSNWVKHVWGIFSNHYSCLLSVSSNGSNWVKLFFEGQSEIECGAFSILERIELGETIFVL